MYNIQVLIDMLPDVKKTKYNQIQALIKTTIRDIKKQKEMITDKVYQKHIRYTPALFEVQPSEIEQIDFEEMSSFFCFIDS